MCDAVKQHEHVTHKLINAMCMLVMDVLLIFYFSSLLLFVSKTLSSIRYSFNHEHC